MEAADAKDHDALALNRERIEALDRALASARAEIEALRVERTRSAMASADAAQAFRGKVVESPSLENVSGPRLSTANSRWLELRLTR